MVLATVAVSQEAVLSVVGIEVGAVLCMSTVAPSGDILVSSAGNSCVGVVIHLVAVTAVNDISFSVGDAGVDVLIVFREISVDEVIVVCSIGTFVKIIPVVLPMVAFSDAAVASVVGIGVTAVLQAPDVTPAGGKIVSSVVNSCGGVTIRLAAVTSVYGIFFFCSG